MRPISWQIPVSAHTNQRRRLVAGAGQVFALCLVRVCQPQRAALGTWRACGARAPTARLAKRQCALPRPGERSRSPEHAHIIPNRATRTRTRLRRAKSQCLRIRISAAATSPVRANTSRCVRFESADRREVHGALVGHMGGMLQTGRLVWQLRPQGRLLVFSLLPMPVARLPARQRALPYPRSTHAFTRVRAAP